MRGVSHRTAPFTVGGLFREMIRKHLAITPAMGMSAIPLPCYYPVRKQKSASPL